jgi:Fic family protein
VPPGRPSRQAIHERVALRVAELNERLGGLPTPDEAEATWTDLWHEDAHHSTAIEGNTLVLHQVEQLLEEGKPVGGKELREYMEVTGYAKAARWVYAEARGDRGNRSLVTLQEVRHIHHVALGDVWAQALDPNAAADESPGSWRRHEIKRFTSGMRPPSYPLVPAEMDTWVRNANAAKGARPFAEHVAQLHADFERIHPFLDGNGRVGRLVLNLLLVRSGYPPAIIFKRQRAAYLNALVKADKADPAPLGELIARAILDNLNRFVLPAIAGDVRLLPLEALAGTDITVTALRAAARRGTLRAKREADGTWVSSKTWVKEYRDSKYRRLRLPRKHGVARSSAWAEAAQ